MLVSQKPSSNYQIFFSTSRVPRLNFNFQTEWFRGTHLAIIPPSTGSLDTFTWLGWSERRSLESSSGDKERWWFRKRIIGGISLQYFNGILHSRGSPVLTCFQQPSSSLVWSNVSILSGALKSKTPIYLLGKNLLTSNIECSMRFGTDDLKKWPKFSERLVLDRWGQVESFLIKLTPCTPIKSIPSESYYTARNGEQPVFSVEW